MDKTGNLWLFGGIGYDAATNTTGVPLNDLWEFSPSLNEWTWMGGSNTLPQSDNGFPGVYGSLGTAATGNLPGSRYAAATWVDTDGDFWLFGGTGCDAAGSEGGLNDLWKFSPVTNEWTWMGGSNTIGPGGGRPGNYGTLGLAAPGNIPGSRGYAVTWTDQAGGFWLFGGMGFDAADAGGFLNDLWEFAPSSKEWTWMGGNTTVPAPQHGWPGVYGTLGSQNAANLPGGRFGSASWTGSDGSLWLFGGSGFDKDGNLTALNDVWKLGFSSKEWTWMGGSATSVGCVTYQQGLVICAGQSGVYGSLGTSSSENIPGGRAGSASWVDGNGNFWLFAGQGYDSADNEGNLNDLWKFTPGSGAWVWLGGNVVESGCAILPAGNTFCDGQPGEYGTLGLPGPGNDPGARYGEAFWPDTQGNLWVFGGYGVGAGNGMGILNDLWEFQQSTTAPPAAAIPAFSPPPGTYSSSQSVVISDTTAGSTIYYTTDGSAPTTNSTIYSGPISVSSSGGLFVETIHAIATAGGDSPSPMASATYAINLPPDFSVAASPGSLTVARNQSGTVTITVTPVNGFSSIVSFACSGLPSGASCSFSPPTVTPNLAPASTVLTVATSAAAAAKRGSSPVSPAAVLAAGLCWLTSRNRRQMRRSMVLFALCTLVIAALSGCGGGSSQSQATTATVTVTAASGSTQHTTSFTLIVN